MSAPTHKALATTAIGVIEEVSLPTPQARADEVLVKVEYSSAVALDGYAVDTGNLVNTYPFPLGLNAAGTVVQVGPGVENVKIGDRVATFGRGFYPTEKSMQEYALLPKYSVSKIPDSLSSPEAATIPDNFVTAYYTLFDSLRLPLPTSLPATSPPPDAGVPILIYGSGATVGQYLIQVLKLAGYTNIFTTASPRHHEYLKSLGATETFDYASPDLSNKIIAAAHGKMMKYVVDCVSTETSLQQIAKVVEDHTIVSMLLPIKEGSAVTGAPGSQMWMELPADRNPFTEGVELVGTKTFLFHENTVIKETLMPTILPKLLAEGRVQPNKVRLFQDGTLKQRAETALDLLRNNKISGEKVIIKIAD